ncbi:hypothetical protein GMOD_00007124 [Pyrenophora seminiperda CCB06]|uniref:Uncharacterized protein n=1 Tax=Pyrenophora seminiperda CCB06 TaxID=1302712 RepID=A0A3M7MCC6_9PLEO|nr:hypothetical protein GMOD_00007124 [Pyrenophora seminiperda CCB06]
MSSAADKAKITDPSSAAKD